MKNDWIPPFKYWEGIGNSGSDTSVSCNEYILQVVTRDTILKI
ncbi:hypothetical protein GGGNBK_11970 [Sporosarcina sp. ANT_H38]